MTLVLATDRDLDQWKESVRKGAADGVTVDKLLKQYTAEHVKVDNASRQVVFTISTGIEDRARDTVAVDGWDVQNYLKNPVVLDTHNSGSIKSVLARAVAVVKSAGQLRATLQFPPAGVNEFSDFALAMIEGGFIRAVSVGFRPLKSVWNDERMGMDFLEQELLEISIVAVPCNPDALLESAKGFAGAIKAGIDLSPLEKAIAIAKSITGKESPVSKKSESNVSKAGRVLSRANKDDVEECMRRFGKAVLHHKAMGKKHAALADELAGAQKSLESILSRAKDDDDVAEDDDETESDDKAAAALLTKKAKPKDDDVEDDDEETDDDEDEDSEDDDDSSDKDDEEDEPVPDDDGDQPDNLPGKKRRRRKSLDFSELKDLVKTAFDDATKRVAQAEVNKLTGRID